MTTNRTKMPDFSGPLFRSGNWKFWIPAALVIRITILLVFISSSRTVFPERIIGCIGIRQNDYAYFLGPVDEYFKTGIFQYEQKPGQSFAGRMPGYSAPYMLLRFVFPRETALCILFALQIVLGACCVYLLSLVAESFLSSRSAFLLTFVISAVSMHTAVFDLFSLTESFSVSAICLFLFFGMRFLKKQENSDLFLSGLFAAWAVFLRPFLGTILILMPIIIAYREKSLFHLRKVVVPSFIFALPFLVFESAWIYRNYVSLGRFIPLETPITESYGERGSYRTSAISIRSLILSWGGESGEFYDGSEAAWFHNMHGAEAEAYRFRPHVFNSVFTRDSLEQLKKDFNMSVDSSMTEQQKDSLNMLASATALRYAESYRNDNLFRYYLLNPLIRAGQLVLSNGTRLMPLPPFPEMSLFQKGIKLFYFALYYLVTVGGFAGMVMYFIRKRKVTPEYLLLALPPLFVIVTMVCYSSILEFRYFITGYPILVVFLTSLALVISHRYHPNRKQTTEPQGA